MNRVSVVAKISECFTRLNASTSLEVQQRSVEYYNIITNASYTDDTRCACARPQAAGGFLPSRRPTSPGSPRARSPGRRGPTTTVT